jgi:predicted HNH restriction endonuclease
MICGIDFGNFYGEEFSGKIEVHHRKPLSEIKEDYVVDPIKDLIPVCPNCHMILHSKKDGVYTVEEVRKMVSGKERFRD